MKVTNNVQSTSFGKYKYDSEALIKYLNKEGYTAFSNWKTKIATAKAALADTKYADAKLVIIPGDAPQIYHQLIWKEPELTKDGVAMKNNVESLGNDVSIQQVIDKVKELEDRMIKAFQDAKELLDIMKSKNGVVKAEESAAIKK